MSINPINMRLYRRFDADLIALHESGIPVNVLAEVLLEIYAKGKQVSLIPDGCEPFDVGKRKCMHLSVNVKSKEAEMLVRQIKRGYRNQFCKSLVRDALRTIPLWVYFSRDEYVSDEDRRLRKFGNERPVIVLPHGLRRKAYRTLILNAAEAIGDEEETVLSEKKTQKQRPEKSRKIKNNKRHKNDEAHEANQEKRESRPASRIQNQFSDDIEGWDKEYKGTAGTQKTEKTSENKNTKPEEQKKTEEEAMSDLMKSFNSLF